MQGIVAMLVIRGPNAMSGRSVRGRLGVIKEKELRASGGVTVNSSRHLKWMMGMSLSCKRIQFSLLFTLVI